MTTAQRRPSHVTSPSITKSPTAIAGLDEITSGGLPKGRPTLICGGPGCGKTLLATEFIARGATQLGEAGVMMIFEENEDELIRNVASLGFDLKQLIKSKKLIIDHIHLDRGELQETGQYDLEGLFVRLNHAIDSLGAKRVVLDTIEALFGGLPNETILRSELHRLLQWLKQKGVTAIITGERGDTGHLTRNGLEEYVADCVIVLDHRTVEQITTRWLRIVKYRGSLHGTNEYPFLIGHTGISVLPITSLALTYPALSERISTGVPRLDAMLGGKGYYRGSSILVTGGAGTGKTSLASAFVQAACQHGDSTLYYSFEESPQQIIRNMASIGIKLMPWITQKRLQIHAVRPSQQGLELHLLEIQEKIRKLKPQVVVVDPITNLDGLGNWQEVNSMFTRLIDYLKTEQITTLLTSLTSAKDTEQTTETAISSLIDSWILLRNLEHSGERNRGLYVLKSRGMAHSNQIREFQLSDQGIKLLDVYVGSGEVYTGASRLVQEARDAAEVAAQSDLLSRLRCSVQQKRSAAAAKIAIVQSELEAELNELDHSIKQLEMRARVSTLNADRMSRQRIAEAESRPGKAHPSRKKADHPAPVIST